MPTTKTEFQLLQYGFSGHRAPATVVLDSVRVPKTRHGRKGISQIHERGARTPGEGLNGEIWHDPMVNGREQHFILSTLQRSS